MATPKKKPWPTKQAMQQIYTNKLWGTGTGKFYSGDGSHNTTLVTSYINCIVSFLKTLPKKQTILDLGCGDFNIGKHLLNHAKHYIAVDIVPELILYNTEHFNADNLQFLCLDISRDSLPQADCVIIRQVLQHLSNAEVQRILDKLVNYKYVILTEHMPAGNFTENLDIISGQGIRLKKQSGVDVLKAPFNFKVKAHKVLLDNALENYKGKLVTTLFTLN